MMVNPMPNRAHMLLQSCNRRRVTDPIMNRNLFQSSKRAKIHQSNRSRIGETSARSGPMRLFAKRNLATKRTSPQQSIIRRATTQSTLTDSARGISTRLSVARHQTQKLTKRSHTTKSKSPSRQQSTATIIEASRSGSRASNNAGNSLGGTFTFQRIRDRLHESLLRPRTLPIPRWISHRHYEYTLSELMGHSSFILVAISYAVDDHLQLRAIAVAGSTSMLFFTYFHPHGRVLWLPFKWNALFIALNSYRIGKVYLSEWRANRLSPEMLKVYNNHLYVVDKIDFNKLMRIGQLETFEEGHIVVEQDVPNRYIRLILEGELTAQRDAQPTYIMEPGNFVSEAGLHSGLKLTGKVESCCSIVARKQVRIMRWDRTELMELLHREPSLGRALKAALSWDIVRKLKGQRDFLDSGEIKDANYWTQKRREQTDARYDAILHNLLRHRDSFSQFTELAKYRTIHHIDDEHHRLALKRFGWTPEEFDEGRFEGKEQDHDEEVVKHDWKWKFNDLMLRVLD